MAKVRTLGRKFRDEYIGNSQNVSLYQVNVEGSQNDVQIAAMLQRYGTVW